MVKRKITDKVKDRTSWSRKFTVPKDWEISQGTFRNKSLGIFSQARQTRCLELHLSNAIEVKQNEDCVVGAYTNTAYNFFIGSVYKGRRLWWQAESCTEEVLENLTCPSMQFYENPKSSVDKICYALVPLWKVSYENGVCVRRSQAPTF